MRIRLTAIGVAAATMALAAQPPEAQLPRFRAGANLVRVDTYVSVKGVALTDLKPEEVEVFEDDRPQTLESLELMTARGSGSQAARSEPTTLAEMRDAAADAARLFTVFFDRFHVSVAGSYRANKPIVEALDKIIGADDMVGVMTPEMSPTAITYSRRTSSIERMITDNWAWGIKDQVAQRSPRESGFEQCYPPTLHPGIAAKMIARLREQQTLAALAGLVTRLGELRPERKFVMLLTEGWALYQRDEQLGGPLDGQAPRQDPLGSEPSTGGIRRPGASDPQRGIAQGMESCERERVMLAFIDHEVEFRQLLQRANRANVSFYPIDARGLIVFDQPTRFDLPMGVDNAWLRDRHDDLKMMADQTDGVAVLNHTNDLGGAMQKMFADVGSYYLASYYSSNPKLDGRFRRIRVEVKREHAEVRARPGYLAPTESEARAAGMAPERPAGSRPAPSPSVTRALDAIAPSRGNLPVRIQAAGGRGLIRAVVELDAATAKQPEWLSGGTLRLTVEPERASASAKSAPAQTVTLALEPGQRSITASGTNAPVAPGRYLVRAEITPRAGRIPLQVSTFVTVPADTAVIGSAALALRRGPSTGLAYIATADPRFRRTERLRIEVPLAAPATEATGRMLTREGQPMPLIVTYSSRVDEATQLRLGVADVTLSALAAGEYVLEFTIKTGSQTEVITYGFRLIP
ncbi:MAG: VWA domain-containing protein [Acidobacteria bacterium]|nr:VWA domain-containing protein [Acidobacteriota bacterium]